MKGRGNMKKYEPIKLSYKQDLVLRDLADEFAGIAFGPQLLEDCENEDLKKLSINEITWAMLRLRDNELVESEKVPYKGRILNRYRLTPYAIYGILEK